MIKIMVFLLQVVFVSFVSNIIQFTFVASMTAHLFININADTVRFYITHVVTKTHRQNFNDANDVVYKTFAVKCFSGVNSNTRHWSASQKPLRFIEKGKHW